MAGLRLLNLIAIVFLLASLYFLSREPVSLLILIPVVVLIVAYRERIGAKLSSLSIILLCIITTLWVNSESAIYGDRYTQKKSLLEDIEKEQQNENSQSVLKVKAEDAVRRLLKDPNSSEFAMENTYPSGYVCGFVNSKNSFGAYSGHQKFISNGIPSSTFIEESRDGFAPIWSERCR